MTTNTSTTRIPMPNSPAIDLKTGFATREWYYYWNQPALQSVTFNGQIGVINGGTGLNKGVSGGVLAFTGTQTITSSQALSQNQIVFGGGPGAVPFTSIGLGTTSSFLRGNALGLPSFGLLLASDLPFVPDNGQGTLLAITRNSKGLITGTRVPFTDDLSEGVSNLYFTVLRAQQAVGLILVSTDSVTLVYDPGDVPTSRPPSIKAALVELVCNALTALSYPNVVAVDGNNNAYYPDLTNPSDVSRIVGVTANAAAINQPVTVVTSKNFTENYWSWLPGRIYCALSGGAFTQTVPTTGAIVEVARVISPTVIRVGLRSTILR